MNEELVKYAVAIGLGLIIGQVYCRFIRSKDRLWWHCPTCGTAVQLHRSDHPVGCHKDGCSNGYLHLLKGKRSKLKRARFLP